MGYGDHGGDLSTENLIMVSVCVDLVGIVRVYRVLSIFNHRSK